MLFAITLTNSLIVVLVVLMHYESLSLLTRFLPKLLINHRFRMVIGIGGALIAHAAEVWVFALAYYCMDQYLNWGTFVGSYNGQFLDCVYFSFTTYTTLGFGDIEPVGHLRFLTGIESLTGMVLITWTASFLYLEMQKYWQDS